MKNDNFIPEEKSKPKVVKRITHGLHLGELRSPAAGSTGIKKKYDSIELDRILSGAEDFVSGENFPEAEKLLLDILENCHDYVPALYTLGRVYISSNRIDDAVNILQYARKISSKNTLVLNLLAYAYYLQKNTDKSVEILERLAVVSPYNVEPLSRIKKIHNNQNPFEEMEKELNETKNNKT